MDPNKKRLVIILISIFLLVVIGLVVYYFITSRYPSTQRSDETVFIDNYTSYTEHISADSFGYLGNYLYEFIDTPSKGVYHAMIVDETYTYNDENWFSKFDVAVKDSDIVWSISMQTIESGEINGDISVTCISGSCVSRSEEFSPNASVLQDYLPITTDEFIMTYQSNDYDTLSVVYYDQEGIGQAKALEKITSLGFNPDDYTIEYFYGGN